jgi:hypothetical protein
MFSFQNDFHKNNEIDLAIQQKKDKNKGCGPPGIRNDRITFFLTNAEEQPDFGRVLGSM